MTQFRQSYQSWHSQPVSNLGDHALAGTECPRLLALSGLSPLSRAVPDEERMDLSGIKGLIPGT
jgi:hypothetical protein